jgi:hypothetical protein
MLFALQDENITENTELAHVFTNIKKKNQCVISPRRHKGPAKLLHGE